MDEDYKLVQPFYEKYMLCYLGGDMNGAANVIFAIINKSNDLQGIRTDDAFIDTIIFMLKEFISKNLSSGTESPESFEKITALFHILYDKRSDFDIRNKAN